MRSQESYIAKIIYINNVNRKEVGSIRYTFSSTGGDILPSIERALTIAGNPFDKNKGQVYLKRDDKLMVLDDTMLLDSKNISIIYSEVIALQNALRYDEVDGIVLFFHMEEHTHLYFPHVHVLYAGEEIVVSLTDFQVTGCFKTQKKVKIAVKYVRENIDNLRKEWDRIQASQLPYKKSI